VDHLDGALTMAPKSAVKALDNLVIMFDDLDDAVGRSLQATTASP